MKSTNLRMTALMALGLIGLVGCGGGGGGSTTPVVDTTVDNGTTPPLTASSTYTGCAVLPITLIARGTCDVNVTACGDGTTKDLGTYSTVQECETALNGWIATWSPSQDNVANGTANAEGVTALNAVRQEVGLPILRTNIKLEEAGTSHANYVRDVLANHNVAVNHYQYDEYPSTYSTGVFPYDRAEAVGYAIDSYVGEALTYASVNPQDAIDELMSAIYHRNGLLFNHIDEIGVGISSTEASGHAHTFELASETSKQSMLRQISPLVVAYPSRGSTDIRRVFYEEYPDPLPSTSMSGYPISIEFNSYYTTTVEVSYFKLYDENNVEITDVTLMDEYTDPNGHFQYNQFALFPMQVLEGSHTYRVEVGYVLNGEAGTKVWSFTTRNDITPAS